jgi:nicotinate-nucleotide adenylyltransferase
MKTLCLGGSFNPIHHGHLICARSVAETLGYDRVTLIPSARPPHKPDSVDLADPQDRLRMCQLAAEQSAIFDVDDIEVNRTGPSFTIETARELKARGWRDVHWLIGADMLNLLPRWHRPRELLDEVHFILMARPGFEFDWSKLSSEFSHLRDRIVEAPRIDISSTDIRRRLRGGLPIDYLTPPSVVGYIRARDLYRANACA